MIDGARLNQHGGDGQSPITAADIAAETGGRLIGPPDVYVRGVAPLDRAGVDELSFLASARYVPWFARTGASVVLIAPQFADLPGPEACTRIVVDKPTDALVGLLARFHRREARATGVHESAVIGSNVTVGADVTIEPFAVIGDGVEIGDRAWIGAHATVGRGTRVGADARVHAGATIYQYVELGERVVVHSGARVGREGFGFVPRADGAPRRIPHVGRCVLEDDVEIGANTCVDRGSVDDTIIGAGTKIDNLCHIAHNVRVGRGCFFAAQVGIAGSTRIGDGVQLGGQAGINGHITIGSRAIVTGQTGVIGDVPAAEMWSGYPARPHREQMRSTAALSRLARMMRPIEQLLRGDGSGGSAAP
ncbi:MAG TPA: UDP-3-O-(3-hydroxymyristoyl)glucosamine N-acyltransferase [Gemmatimonas sp.]|nr:UDP-3-O-(3-hydroxymyristoyl)glucosamine N-acyltransferase [Gemmatimonas sp.]